jgi:Na+/melibiose symporter-like transporter
MDDISDYLISDPNVIWLIVIIGAVAVIGLVDFLKCWITGKKKIKWIVLIVSLVVSAIMSPLVPALVTTIVILWLLILAVSTMARNAIAKGLPNLIGKFMGGVKPDDGGSQ